MLVITRKVGDSFMIGNDIKVVIVEVKGKQVRVGIEAPKTIHVERTDRDGKASESRAPGKSSKRTI